MYVFTYYHIKNVLQILLIVITILYMSKQIQTNGIPAGFGERLKRERKRLGLSQEAFAKLGGVQRLAQIQYENENTAPTTKYLNLIKIAGADLSYLLLGIDSSLDYVSPDRMKIIHDKTFELIEKFAENTATTKFSPETYKMLFNLIVGILIQVEKGTLPKEIDILSLVNQGK